ncbi:MAG: glycoside hydrolase family 5 protein [Oscillospiraceae bacterium]|nr:glycoside hydrolase family 5 protein [Oscillospiraceae bacterium]
MKKIAAAIAALLAVSMALSSCSSGSENSSESPAKETSLPQTELQDMRDITASELVSEMKTGFSLGNTMDSTIGKNNGEPYEYETGWGNQTTTREAIQGIADSGFNVLRVPVSWGEHLSSDGSYTIDKAWLDRVNEIVDYGLDAGMFVILNTHHEEWLFPDEAHFEANSEELAKLWSQIAERFSGYNEKLIFEGLNEPRKRDTIYEWNGGDEEGQQVVNKLNAVFVETVRNSGGNNGKRCLMIPTYAASAMEKTFAAMEVPENDDRIIVSVHAYIPYNFALASDNFTDYWSSSDPSCTAEIDNLMTTLKAYFLDKGIPAIIGEMGCVNRNNTEARKAWARYYVGKAHEYGIPCLWWDNGAYLGNGELFGIYSRDSGNWIFRDVMEGIMEGLE